MRLLTFLAYSAIIGACLGAPRKRDREWRFSGVSGRLRGRQNQSTETEAKQFGSSRLESLSFSVGQGSESDFDLESFVGFGKLPEKKENSVQVPKATGDRRPEMQLHTVIETESSATANEGAVSAGSLSGITGGKDLEAMDLDSFAGVNEKEGYGHSSSRAVGNGGANRREGKTRNIEDLRNDRDGLSVAAVGALASVAKGNSGSTNGDGPFWDHFFTSSSRLSSRRSNDTTLSGRLSGFSGDAGSFGITFEDKE